MPSRATEAGAPPVGAVEDKVAVVTGAARGMGEAMARLLAAEGARVVVADVLDEQGQAVADDLGDAGLFAHVDTTDPVAWERLLEGTLAEFGAPDVLVNNAGILRVAPLASTDPETFEDVLRVNLVGPFLGIRSFGPVMAAAGRGSIVNIASIGGLMGMSTLGAYAASKWGLRGLGRTAAIELGPSGVRVNTVLPGAVATPMTGVEGLDPLAEPPAPGTVGDDPRLAAVDAMSAGQPIARAGRAVEMARLVLFLASDASSYCTGAEFVADGGASAGRDLDPDWASS